MAKGAGKFGGKEVGETHVRTQSGDIADLTDTPLIYGGTSNIPDGIRDRVEKSEEGWLRYKREHGSLFDENGYAIVNDREGTSGHVGWYLAELLSAETLTHSHPRGKGEEGAIGGTFSLQDVSVFTKYDNLKHQRASAHEGVYTMSKGKNFDGDGLVKYYETRRKEEVERIKKIWTAEKESIPLDAHYGDAGYKAYRDKVYALHRKYNNQILVAYHNILREGQKQFGYTYSLERRKPKA